MTSRLLIPVVAVTLLPATALLVSLLLSGLPTFHVAEDAAIIELNTLDASKGHQLLGPYSRFGFHHPGPAMFYVLAPFYRLSGCKYAILPVTAALLNLTVLFLLIVLVARIGSVGAAVCFCFIMLMYSLYLGPWHFQSVWNPYLPLLAFLFSVFSCGGLLCNRHRYMPLTVLAGMFAAQSHVAYAVPLIAVGTVTLVFYAFPLLRISLGVSKELVRMPRSTLAISMIVLLLALVPVLLEQATAEQGNITKMLKYSSEPGLRVGLVQSINVVATTTGSFLIAPACSVRQMLENPWTTEPKFTGAQKAIAAILALGQFIVLPFIWRIAKRESNYLPCALVWITSVLVLSAVFWVSRLPAPLDVYLVRWISGIGVISTFTVISPLISSITRFLERRCGSALKWIIPTALVAVAALLSALNLGLVVRMPTLSTRAAQPKNQTIRQMAAAVQSKLREAAVREPRIAIYSNDSWGAASGVLLHLVKEGWPVSVDYNYLFMFGPRYESNRHDASVIFCQSQDCRNPSLDGLQPVTQGDGTKVFLSQFRETRALSIDLASPAALNYLDKGFYSVERDSETTGFRWSFGMASFLKLPLQTHTDYRLAIEAEPLSVAGMTQTLTIKLNGWTAGRMRMDPGRKDYFIELPADRVQAVNRIAFLYAYAFSPSSLRMSGDSRIPAMRFWRIAAAPIQ